MKVIWSPLAIERVVEIGRYIHEENPIAADVWTHKIFDRIKQLETFPQSGRVVPERRRPDTKELIWGNYRIIYVTDEKSVQIATVIHAARLLHEGMID